MEITDIRRGRPKPGLRPQHLASVRAAVEITSGRVSGAEPGSTRLVYTPGPRIRPGDYAFDVSAASPGGSSAGSVGLVFQTVAVALALAGGRSGLTIKGGTHVAWSPPADYIRDVYLRAAARMGVVIDLDVREYGFYPLGGGAVHAEITPSSAPLRPIDLSERGRLAAVSIRSAVSNLPASIAERQLASATKLLAPAIPSAVEVHGESAAVPGPGRGTYCFILLEFEGTRAGFTALGARGRRAEAVGAEAAELARDYIASAGAADPHLADQLIPVMALASGTSTLTTTEITPHLLTNIDVVKKFLEADITVRGTPGGPGTVRVEGAGLY